MTLSLTINETLNIKMALVAAHLNAEVILVVTEHRQAYNLPLSPPPSPLLPPSLISLMVYVDVIGTILTYFQ